MFRSAFILLVLSVAVYTFSFNDLEDLLFEDEIVSASPHRVQARGNIVNAGHVKKQTIFNVDNGRGGNKWMYPSVSGGQSGKDGGAQGGTGGGGQSGTGGGAQAGTGSGAQGGTGGGAQGGTGGGAQGGTGGDGKDGRDGKDTPGNGETGEGGGGRGKVKHMKIKIKDLGGS